MRFLTPEEVFRLTGYKQKRLQCQGLMRQRIPFVVNARGEPVVLMSAVEGSRKPAAAAAVASGGWEPAVLTGSH